MPEKLNKARVLGVLAGDDFPLDRLVAWANAADIVLCADGGANLLNSCGLTPDVTVGDLDSISASTKAVQRELVHIPDQNSTDCDKLLALAEQRGYEAITLVCIEGDLFDHTLGALYSAASSPLEIRIALRRGIGLILRGPVERRMDLPASTRLSLIPLTLCGGVTLEGVEWPLSEATLTPPDKISISNRASGAVRGAISAGTALLVLSHPELELPFW